VRDANAYRVRVQSRVPDGRVLAFHDSVVSTTEFVPPRPLAEHRAKVTVRLNAVCGAETSAETVSTFAIDTSALCQQGDIEADAAGAKAGLQHDLSVGHYKPINSDRFLHDCQEFVFHFSPAARTRIERLALGVKYQDKSNVTRWRGAANDLRCRGNTWFIPYATIQSRDRDRPHPATFPSRLPEYCIRLHGLKQVQTIMDPFLGLGSTAVAAARLKVGFIGIELDEHYLKEAIARTRAELR
jgi:hypothetical protein